MALVQALARLIGQACSLGIPVGVIVTGRGRPAAISGAVSGALVVLCGIGAAVLAVLALASTVFPPFLLPAQPSAELLMLLGGWIGVASMLQAVALAGFRGLNRFVSFNALTLFGRILAATLLVAFLLKRTDAVAAAAGLAVANAIFLLVVIVAAVRRYGMTMRRWRVNALLVIRANVAGHVGTILQEVAYRVDLFILAALSSTADVGRYAVVVVVIEAAWYPADAIGAVLLARTAGDGDIHLQRLERAASASNVLTSVAVVSAAMIGAFLVPKIVGREFGDLLVPILLLMPGVAALGLWKVVVTDAVARGRSDHKAWTAGVGASTACLGDLLLIPRLGVNGAALASSCGYVAALAGQVVLSQRSFGLRPERLFQWEPRLVIAHSRASLRRR